MRILARSKRTVIRPFSRLDVDRMVSWPKYREPFLGSYNLNLTTVEDRDVWFAIRCNREDYRLFAVDSSERLLIGNIRLMNIDPPSGRAALGIVFRPDYVGAGYGSEALKAFAGYYFGAVGMKSLWLEVAAFNLRAKRCYLKCGFKFVGSCWREFSDEELSPQPEDPQFEQAIKKVPGGILILHERMELTREEFLKLSDETDCCLSG